MNQVSCKDRRKTLSGALRTDLWRITCSLEAHPTPTPGSVNTGASTETGLSAWKTYKTYFVPLHKKKKKTQVTNFKIVINGKFGQRYRLSGGS